MVTNLILRQRLIYILQVSLMSLIALQLQKECLPDRTVPKISGATKKAGIDVSITSSKVRYKVGERLVFKIQISNQGTKSQIIYRTLLPRDSIYLNFYDVAGHSIDASRASYHPAMLPMPTSRADFIEIAPGFFFGREMSSSQYSMKSLPKGIYWVNTELSIKDYSESLKFEHWHGNIQSRAIQVTIE